MTAVTMSMKVRVVLIELHMGSAERMVAAFRRPLGNTLPGTVVGKKVFQCSAFRCEYSGCV